MAVSVIETAVGTDAGSTSGTQTATLSATPVAGDVVVVTYASTRNPARNVSSISGLGATWARAGSLGADSVEFWIGTGATTAGTVTVTQTGGGRAVVSARLVRGLTATTSVVSKTNTTSTVSSFTGPAQNGAGGQIVITGLAAGGGGTVTYPSAEAPGLGGWTAYVQPDGSSSRTAGAYRIPSGAAASHRTDVSGTSGMVGVTSAILTLGDAGAAGTTVNVGQAVESDTGLTATAKVGATVTLGRATETSVGLAAAALVGVVIPLGMAVESDTARPTSVELITPITVNMGRALESDTALAVSAKVNATVALGQAAEADSALSATVRQGDVYVLGQAVESDSAQALTVDIVIPPQTDVSNRTNGIRFVGYGTHTYEPYVVVPPAALVVHDMVKAQAFEAPTRVGNRPQIEATIVHKKRTRERLLIGGKDVTVWRGVACPIPEYELMEPFLYGSGSGVIPQITMHEWASGVPRWLKHDKPVIVQSVDVDTNEVVGVRYRGFIDTLKPTPDGVAYTLGGKLAGSMALAIKPPPVFPVKQDAGRFAYWAVRGNGVRFTPALGPETGVQIMNTGGGTELEFLTELLALTQLRDGTMWTVSERPNGTWGMWAKDRETVHATVYFDHAHMQADLDPGERVNRVFATAVGPDGRRITGNVYPGLRKADAPPFPGALSEGDTGDSVTALINRLAVVGYLTIEAASTGGFDGQVTRAIKRLQDDANLSETGVVNLATWKALFDLGVTSYSLSGAMTLPLAQRTKVRQWDRSASGAIFGRNPSWDPSVKRRDRWVDMGPGVTGPQQAREFARQQLDNAVGDWAGTLACNLGGLIAGQHVPGTAFDSTDIIEAADIKPGMNIWEPHWEGGTLFHVVHSRVGRTSDGRPSVTLTLDTRARDAAPVFEIIKRRRESRRSPSRSWEREYRSSRHQKDALGEWDAVAGLIDKVELSEGWNVFPVVAGREGTIQRFRLRLISPTQFGVALFGKKVTAARLAHVIGNPLTGTSDKWQKPHVQGWLEDHIYLESWGDSQQPCGFWPGQKTGDDGTATGDDVTGKFYDAGGISYRTFREPVLYVAVYAQNAAVVPAGRIMWDQFEAGS